jgi:hypothetical protein
MKRFEDRDYLSFKLDSTSSSAPIYANVFDDEDGERLSLARGCRESWLMRIFCHPSATDEAPQGQSNMRTPCRKPRPDAKRAKVFRPATRQERRGSRRRSPGCQTRRQFVHEGPEAVQLRMQFDRQQVSRREAAMPANGAPNAPAPP